VPLGNVKFFDIDRGFGFIEPDDGSADIFVHISDARMSGFDALLRNQRLEYDVSSNSRTGRTKAVALREPLPEGI
jgi:CspA family cold shock protein